MLKDQITGLIDYDEVFDFGPVSSNAAELAMNVVQGKKPASGIDITPNLLAEYARIYGMVRAHRALLKAVYKVKIENIFNHRGNIPWFNDPTLCYLATDSAISLGSRESDSFYAGSYQAGFLTRKSSGDMDVTFIETANGDIAKSYKACDKLAFNADGTVNETRKYAFKLTVALLNPLDTRKVAVQGSWLVGVKGGSAEVSSTGRSDVVQIPITFEKLRPLSFSI